MIDRPIEPTAPATSPIEAAIRHIARGWIGRPPTEAEMRYARDAIEAAPATAPSLRERFEVWAKAEQCDLTLTRGGSYSSTFTDLAWQAVVALSTEAAPAESAEAVPRYSQREGVPALIRDRPEASAAEAPEPTLPVEIYGKWYEVPIPVQLHIVALETAAEAPETLTDLLHRMLEAPTTQVSTTWKATIRPVLLSLIAPDKFGPMGGCTCAGPDGPCEACVANREAYEEWQAERAGPAQSWRCFHCSESFTDPKLAEEHFGRSEMDLPICKIDAAEYRAMEERMHRYNNDDSDLHREIHGLIAKHCTELRREEEAGYEKGLKDGRARATPPTALQEGAETPDLNAARYLQLRDLGTCNSKRTGFEISTPLKALVVFRYWVEPEALDTLLDAARSPTQEPDDSRGIEP